MTDNHHPPVDEPRRRRAEEVITSEQALFDAFLGKLERFGTFSFDEHGFVAFSQHGEESWRTFAITPWRLRMAFVEDVAYRLGRGENVAAVDSLPQWFIDHLWETVGSDEEPYADPYVILVGSELYPSSNGRHPASGSAPAGPVGG